MITPLAFAGGWVGKLLGSKVFWEIMLFIVLVAGVYAWMIHEQNLGAAREQVKQQAAQIEQERAVAAKTVAALTQRAAVAESARNAAEAAQRRFQEAMSHDKATIDWRAVCGARALPCRVREYIEGRMPPDCAKAAGANAGSTP